MRPQARIYERFWTLQDLLQRACESRSSAGNKKIFMVKDTLSDMFTIIKNAGAVGKERAQIPYSKLKMDVLKVFLKSGFIKDAAKKGKKSKRIIEITLSYDKNGKHAVTGIKRISKLSRRVYVPYKKLRYVAQGYGIAILSTPKGILRDKEARKERAGGEVLCEVW